MPDGSKIPQRLAVNSVAYERLKNGNYAIVPVLGESVCVNDNIAVAVSSASPEIMVTVSDVVYLQYPPEGYKSWNGSPFGIIRRTTVPKESMLQRLVTIVPVKKAETDMDMDSITLIHKWRETLEEKARKLAVSDSGFQNAGNPLIECHFDGKQLDEDEFCALTYKEQVGCLQKLSMAINHRLNILLKAVSDIRGHSDILRTFGS